MGMWYCTTDCVPEMGACVLIDCDDGDPCTDDSFIGGGCVHTPVRGAELIVLEMPELAGGYLFNAREANVSLGFRLFEIGCMAIEWAGGIYTSTVDCFGDLQGYGGTLAASFVGLPLPRATYSETLGEPLAWIPFGRTDVFSGGTFDFLLDGNATVHVFFDQVIQECVVVEPASAVLDSVGLIIAGRRMHDFDGDARMDIVTANSSDHNVTLIRNLGRPACYADCDSSTGVGVLDLGDFPAIADFIVSHCGLKVDVGDGET